MKIRFPVEWIKNVEPISIGPKKTTCRWNGCPTGMWRSGSCPPETEVSYAAMTTRRG